MLSIGDLAPDFSLPDQNGRTRTLAEFHGKTLVLYFYPKDMTPGCTTEACDVRDAYAAHDIPTGVTILGVSADSPARHAKFIAKEGLNFDLLSDETHAMLEAYGVWTEKSMYGRKFQGIERSTFVIGPDGRITAIYRKVKVPGHIAEVLRAI